MLNIRHYKHLVHYPDGGCVRAYLLLLAFLLFPPFFSYEKIPNTAGESVTDTLLPVLYPSRITSYDIDNGLPASCVYEATADLRGRLWLNACHFRVEFSNEHFFHFDGYESHRVQLEAPPADGQGPAIVKGTGQDGNLYGWYKNSSRFFIFNPETYEVQYYSLPAVAGNQPVIYFIAPDEAGRLFIYAFGSGRHLFFRLEGDRVQELGKCDGTLSEVDNLVKGKYLFADGRFWFFDHIGSYNPDLSPEGWKKASLICFDVGKRTVKAYPIAELLGIKLPELIHKLNWAALSTDFQGQVIIYSKSTDDYYKLDPQSGQARQFDPFPEDWDDPEMNDYHIEGLSKDRKGNLLIWRWSGLHGYQGVLQDSSGQWHDCRPVLQSALSASRYKNSSLYVVEGEDFQKQMILCTEGGLIAVEIKLTEAIQSFLTHSATRAIAQIAPNRFIVNLDLDAQREFSTDGQDGSTIINLERCPNYDADKRMVQAFADMHTDDNGYLWIAGGEDGLLQINLTGGDCQFHPTGFRSDKFTFLTDNQIILAGAENNNIYVYDLDKKMARLLSSDFSPPVQGQLDNDILIARDTAIWVATMEGLWKIDYPSGNSRRFGMKEGLPDNRAMCLHEDEQSRLWVGTFGSGLVILDPLTGAFRTINVQEGLSNNTVIGILADEEGILWVSTYNGINLISPEGNVLVRLYEADGLSANEFNRYSYCKSHSGQLLFGSIAGVNVIDPVAVKDQVLKKGQLQIFLTGMDYYDKKRGEEIFRDTPLLPGEVIVLPASARYLHLKFALSNLIQIEENQFAYQIVDPSAGQEEKWSSIGNNPELNLNSLPAGRYNILIRGCGHRGAWTQELLVIPIFVREFFYRQVWFYILLFLFFSTIGLAYALRERNRRRQLERIVAQRTQKIREDKRLIEEQAQKLKEMDVVKTRFFTNISHEFRTPLTIISGMAGQIMENPQKWAQKGGQMIRQNSASLLSLVNQILDLRKLEAKEMKLNMVQGDVVKYLAYLVESYVPYAQSKGVQLHFLPAMPSLAMDFDPEKMMRIISNLFSNAVKYTPDKGNIYFHLDKLAESGKQLLRLRVQDTGSGISKDKLPYIFDRFYQVDDSATRKGEGTGIGLALVRELVHLLGGRIEVSSVAGKGATFTLLLPVTNNSPVMEAIVPEAPQQIVDIISAKTEVKTAPEKEGEEDLHQPDLPTLLIVEDNPDIRQFLVACLENTYQLSTADNGQEGIEKAIEQVPDLIISDVMMPVKDGFELCETLKEDERTSHIPIILLTAKADMESKITGLRTGADAYLAKPFEPEELTVRLEKLFELRKKLQERYRSPSPEQALENKEDAFVQKVRQVILDNISDEDFGIAHLCRAVALSRAQLHNKLKALTGQSASIFIRSIRLNKARELLKNTDLNVSEVGYEVGFRNPSHFSAAFFEEFGVAPSKTRK